MGCTIFTQEGLLDTTIDPKSGFLPEPWRTPLGLVPSGRDPTFKQVPWPTGLNISSPLMFWGLLVLSVCVVFIVL